MAYVTPAPFVSGNVLTAAQMTVVRSDLEEVAKAPMGWAYSTANQTVLNGTGPQVTFAATYALRNVTFASNTLTVAEAGHYLCNIHISWGSSTGGIRAIQLLVNGALYNTEHTTPGAAPNWGHQTFTGPMMLAAGNTVSANVFQDSGGSLAVQSGSFLWLHMLSRL